MTKTDELANKFINKIIEFDHSHFHSSSSSDDYYKKSIDKIKRIIDNNDDYLLTDSFLDFMVFYGEYDYTTLLDELCGNNIEKLDALMRYYGSIFNEFFYRLEGHYYSYAVLLDDDMKEILSNVSKQVKPFIDRYSTDFYGYNEIPKIINIVFAYYTLNKREGNIYDMCNIFLDNPESTLDSLFINDIYGQEEELSTTEGMDRLITFVANKIENHNIKEIK